MLAEVLTILRVGSLELCRTDTGEEPGRIRADAEFEVRVLSDPSRLNESIEASAQLFQIQYELFVRIHVREDADELVCVKPRNR